MGTAVGRYDAECSRILVKDRDVVRALQDLELIRHAPGLWRDKPPAVWCCAGIIRATRDSEFLRAGLQHRSGRGYASRPRRSTAASALATRKTGLTPTRPS